MLLPARDGCSRLGISIQARALRHSRHVPLELKRFTMIVRSPRPTLRKALLAAGAAVALIVGALVGTPGMSLAAGSLPCDIYAAASTPCVAAHSTTRALFSAYSGNLYQVKRASDSTTKNIRLLAMGG